MKEDKKMNMASYPDTHYICIKCKRDLGRQRSRLLNPAKAKSINIVNNHHFCNKCYNDLPRSQLVWAKGSSKTWGLEVIK